MPRRTADEFSEGGIPFDYLSDEAKENAIDGFRDSQAMDSMAYDNAYECTKSIERSLESVGCSMSDYSIGVDGSYAYVQLDDEDQFDSIVHYNGTYFELPDMESDGLYIGELMVEDYDKWRLSVQAEVDAINKTIESHAGGATYGDRPGGRPYIWVYDDAYGLAESETEDARASLAEKFIDAIQKITDEAVAATQDECEAMYDDEYISDYLRDNDAYLFDEDGNLM